jgi:hypothetical protein
MGARLIDRALAEWRDGEQLLRELPRIDPDHDAVRRTVIDLRETYRILSESSDASRDVLAQCEHVIEHAHETIASVKARRGQTL